MGSRIELGSHQIYALDFQHPEPQNVIFWWNRVIAGTFSLRWGHFGADGPPIHLGRRGMPCEQEGRDGGDVSTSQGAPDKASKPPGAAREDTQIHRLGRKSLCPHLHLRLLSLGHQKWDTSHFYCLSCPVCGACYSSSGKPIHPVPSSPLCDISQGVMFWKLPGEKNASSESLEYWDKDLFRY